MSEPSPQDRLAPWLRGELDAAEESALLAAARADASLAEEAEGYRRMLAELRDLRREVAPERDLFPAIAVRLRAAGRRHVRVLLWTAALAAGLVLLLGALLAWRLGRSPLAVGGGSPVERQASAAPGPTAEPAAGALAQTAYAATDRELARIHDELRRAIEARAGALPPATRLLLFENLKVIDRAIRDVESAIVEQPTNADLARTYVSYRRRQIDLLRQANRAASRL